MTAELIDLTASLASAPDLFEVPEEDEARERFRVINDRMAAWAMRRLASVQNRRADIQQIAADEKARIDGWAASQLAPLDRDVSYFEALLGEYAIDVRDTDGRKSVSTPYGVVKTRTVGGGWAITDEAALVEWAKQAHPELVDTVERFALARAKKVLETVGDGTVGDPVRNELVPGLAVKPQDVTTSVEITRPGPS